MILHPRLTFLLPYDIEEVPADKVGIYSFCLSFPSDYELGLGNPTVDSAKVIQIIKGLVARYHKVYEHASLHGWLKTEVNALHLRTEYIMHAIRDEYCALQDLIDNYLTFEGPSLKTIRVLTSVLRNSFLFSGPLYIGMTANQSFATRLQQHIGNQSNFSCLLKEHGVSWSELRFECIPLERISASGIHSLEKIVQSLFRPSLCRG